MKRIIPIVILLVAVLSVFVWYYQSTKVSKKSDIQNILVDKTEKLILLYPLSGDVSFKIKEDGIFEKATTSPTIIPNQSIVHTDNGKASVLLPDNSSISLDNNTEITVNFSEKNTSIYQSFGATYHRVEKLLSGSSYQVQTAGTLASVRGTKFAVRYDRISKKTKVAVTENKVEVSTVSKTIGGTPKTEEVIILGTGKTVIVETDVKISPEQPSRMSMADTVNDTEMRNWVDEQKKDDDILDNLKKETSQEKDFRTELKRVLFNDTESETPQNNEKTTATDSINKEEVKEVTPEKKEEVIKTDTTKTDTIIKTTDITATPKPVVSTVIVNKMSEEEFFNLFEPLFMKYFYIDDTDDVICSVNAKGAERVRIVTSFAESKGYPFEKPSLLSFAQAIDEYCVKKDNVVKARLQARFDDEYPF